jgi:hypothetical protein
VADIDYFARLKLLAALKRGDPMPDWLPVNGWLEPVAEVHQWAVDEIERLRRMRDG